MEPIEPGFGVGCSTGPTQIRSRDEYLIPRPWQTLLLMGDREERSAAPWGRL